MEDQFVPLWDDVRDGAPRIRLTEGNTTVHATGSLILELVFVKALGQLSPVTGPGLCWSILLRATFVLHETLRLIEHEGSLFLDGGIADCLFDILKVRFLCVRVLLLGILGWNSCKKR